MNSPVVFDSLKGAVDYIAVVLDTHEFSKLANMVGAKDEPVASGLPKSREYCLRAIDHLAATSSRTDLRTLHLGREFPTDADKFKLGGHASELGHIHVDFEKQGICWKVARFWLCR